MQAGTVVRTAGLLSFVIWAWGCGAGQRPQKEATAQQRERRLERGRYLVEGVMACFACHSDVDWQATGAPPKPGRQGAGSVFPEKTIPFRLVASNITPDPETGIGRWSDQELARAIRDGIGRDGRVLFPQMPYLNFRILSDDDLASVIAYLRSLPPVHHDPGKSELPEAVRTALQAPVPVGSVPPPDLSTPVRRGAYYARLAHCDACHTPKGPDFRSLAGMDFAGGFVLSGPWGTVAAANLTPHASGIPYYDETLFVEVMRTGRVGARRLNPIMLWGYYRHMTEEDLKGVFAYLRASKPVAHRVDNTEPVTFCRRCGARHGLGGDNP
ncbi:MAG TPA: c-type cytochrome [Bryobacteraceae bacterium]|nr:c-type cytochrome [Bryobacteraceae bacterium]